MFFGCVAIQLLQSSKNPTPVFFQPEWGLLCWSVFFSRRTFCHKHHRTAQGDRRDHTSILLSQKRRNIHGTHAVSSRTSRHCLAASWCPQSQFGDSSLRSEVNLCGRVPKLLALLDGNDMAQQEPPPLWKKPRRSFSSCIGKHWKRQIFPRI